jgi:hypothetical protein
MNSQQHGSAEKEECDLLQAWAWHNKPADPRSKYVIRFCAELAPASTPVLVPSRPEKLRGNGPYPLGRCYQDVADYQSRWGGTFQLGWMIVDTDIYLRAYHHCVHWNGSHLTNLSFNGSYSEITFLPTADPGIDDEAFAWCKQQGQDGVPGRFYPLECGGMVKRIVSMHEMKTRLERFSAEWWATTDEVYNLEASYHEWKQEKSRLTKRRRRLAKR